MLLMMFRSGSDSAGGFGFAAFVWVIYVAIFLGAPLAIFWRQIVQRVRGFGGRNWPTATATIDDFSIDECEIPGRGRSTTIYEVVLQYVFHTPEMQIGEFRREFDERSDAEDWANSFKGCTVKVHVDPKDPQKSVLRKEDLDNAAFPDPRQKLTTSN